MRICCDWHNVTSAKCSQYNQGTVSAQTQRSGNTHGVFMAKELGSKEEKGGPFFIQPIRSLSLSTP